MDPRPVSQWIEILGKTNASHCSAGFAAATCILGNIVGYNFKSLNRIQDAHELANALEAYATMIQQVGVKLPVPDPLDAIEPFEYRSLSYEGYWIGQYRRRLDGNWRTARWQPTSSEVAALAGAKVCAWQSIVDTGEVWKMSASICELARQFIQIGVLHPKVIEVG